MLTPYEQETLDKKIEFLLLNLLKMQNEKDNALAHIHQSNVDITLEGSFQSFPYLYVGYGVFYSQNKAEKSWPYNLKKLLIKEFHQQYNIELTALTPPLMGEYYYIANFEFTLISQPSNKRK